MSDATPKPMRTQSGRRVVFGLNVVVSVAVVVLIVIGMNWVGKRSSRRFDLTALGSYSLSAQTRKVLSQLDGRYEIVTLFGKGRETQRARDLIDEYARVNPALKVRHLNASRDVVRVDAFLASLRDRFGDSLKDVRSAIDDAIQALVDAGADAGRYIITLDKTTETPNPPHVAKTITDLSRFLSRYQRQSQEAPKTLATRLDASLPDYAGMHNSLSRALAELDGQFAAAKKVLDRHGDSNLTPAPVREHFLALSDGFAKTRQRLVAATEKLRKAQPPVSYSDLRIRVMGESDARPLNTVLLIGPRRIRALQLDGDIFVITRKGKDASNPEIRFQGEERITGALISLVQERMPEVVFVVTDRPDPWRGNHASQMYTHVRDRLKRMDFEVSHWTPLLQQNDQMVPIPPPKPVEGQKRVWVIIPPDLKGGPQALVAGRGLQEIAKVLGERLKAGDGAMIMTHVTPRAGILEGNPVLPLIKSYGVNVQIEKMLMREKQIGRDRSRVVLQMETNQWPAGTPMTDAIQGLPAMFFAPSPLTIEQKNAVVKPIVTIAANRLWAEDDPRNRTFVEAKSKPSFTVGAAVQRDNTRLIVLTDRVWASDALTTAGEVDGQLVAGGAYMPGVGARFPANTELFVNGVCWLAGLDDLIAPAARTQDVPRVGAITKEGRKRLMVATFVGMPGAVFVAGVVVWYLRRRD